MAESGVVTRKYPRVNTQAAVSVVGSMESMTMTTVQIGRGGAMLLSQKGLEVGRTMAVDMALDDQVVMAMAKVIYVMPVEDGLFRSGVQFIYLPPSDDEVLREFIDARITREN